MHAVVLRYLDQVARVGSIRRAAEQLNVASSAVNRQILKLEKELGVPIFERRGNGVRLTPAGEQLLRHTRGTLDEWRRTRAEIAAISGDIRGEVRITAIPSLLVRVVPCAIAAIAKRCNTFPAGVRDVEERHAGDGRFVWMEHAERHAIYEAARRGAATEGAHITSTFFPGIDCAGAIVDAGIAVVDTPSPAFDDPVWGASFERSQVILREGGVEIRLIQAEHDRSRRRSVSRGANSCRNRLLHCAL